MGRRSDHSKEELLRMALDAALKLVHQGGGEALTIRAVAKAIGYAPGTLYNLFENRDELVLQVNAATLADLRAALNAVTLSGGPNRDVRALAEAYIAFTETNATAWSLLFSHSMEEGSHVPEWYKGQIAQGLGALEQALLPLFPSDPRGCGEAARTLWAAIHGIVSLAQGGKLEVITHNDARVMAFNLIDVYLAGIRAEQERRS